MESNINFETALLIALAAGIYFGGNLLIAAWVSRLEGKPFFTVLLATISRYDQPVSSKIHLARILLFMIALSVLIVAFV